MSQHRELQICSDLCLGTKHAIVKNKKRITEGARISKESVSVAHGKPTRYIWEVSYVDRTSGTTETIDVRELAGRCFFLWQEFLLERDLLRR